MNEHEHLVNMLSMLTASCEKYRAMHRDIWDTREPDTFYLDRNIDWARKLVNEANGKAVE